MRIYDSRLGRFLSVDPLTGKFAMLTPYQFGSNTPIQAVDLDGEEARVVIYDMWKTSNGKTVFNVKTADENHDYNQRFSDNANQNKFGKTGTLIIINNLDNKSTNAIYVPEYPVLNFVQTIFKKVLGNLPQIQVFGSNTSGNSLESPKPDFSKPIHNIDLGSKEAKAILELVNLSFPEVPETPKGGIDNYNELGRKLNELADVITDDKEKKHNNKVYFCKECKSNLEQDTSKGFEHQWMRSSKKASDTLDEPHVDTSPLKVE